MLKRLSLVLVVAALGLAACGDEKETPTEPTFTVTLAIPAALAATPPVISVGFYASMPPSGMPPYFQMFDNPTGVTAGQNWTAVLSGKNVMQAPAFPPSGDYYVFAALYMQGGTSPRTGDWTGLYSATGGAPSKVTFTEGTSQTLDRAITLTEYEEQ